MRIFLVLVVVAFSGCKITEIAFSHAATGISIAAKIDADAFAITPASWRINPIEFHR